METQQVDSRTWLVTGSSSGLGRCLVEAIVAAGDRVVATARNPDALAELACRAPDQVRCLALDMTSPEQIKAVALDAWAAWGSIDVLVNNAGYALIGALEEYDESQMQRCLDTNFWGPIRLIRALLPHLREARRGHLVHVSAAAALGNYPGFSIYGAAKLAMEGVFESLAQELRPFGIRTTLIQPGPFRTDFIRRSMESARHTLDAYATTSGRFQQYLAKVDGKQPGDPERAAALLVRLIQSGSAPTRLVLGNYAIDKARKRFKSLEQDLVAHEADCRATDRSA